MGFECGFFSTKRDSITNKYHDLCYLGNPGDGIDNYIVQHGTLNGETIEVEDYVYDVYNESTGTYNKKMVSQPNEGYEYLITYNTLINMRNRFEPLFRLFNKYSERVIYQLSEYLSGYEEDRPTEISKADISIIKDYQFNMDTNREPEVYSLYHFCNVLFAMTMLEDDLIKDGVIYWRSW